MFPQMREGIGEREHVMIRAEEAAKRVDEMNSETFSEERYAVVIKREVEAFDTRVKDAIEKLERSADRLISLQGVNPAHKEKLLEAVEGKLRELGYSVLRHGRENIQISW